MFLLRERLSAYKPATEHAAIAIGAEHFEAALREHARLAQQGGKNLLMPKPKRDDEEDLDWPVWAGVIPLRTLAGEPVTEPDSVARSVPPTRFG